MTPFMKTALLVSLSFILHTSVMASAHDEVDKPKPWPVYLGSVLVNGAPFTPEEMTQAQDGRPLTRGTYIKEAKALVLTMHGARVTVGAFDPESEPLWCAQMKQRREAQESDVWYYPNSKSSVVVAMENATDEGVVESLLFMRFKEPTSIEDRTVAGYLTRDISSTLASKFVVFGVDSLIMTLRLPTPLSWIWPNLSHMRLNGKNCVQKARNTDMVGEKIDRLDLTIPADKSANLFVRIEGQDIRCSIPDSTFCEAWRGNIWTKVSAHTHAPPHAFEKGAFYEENGLFFGSAHKNDDDKPIKHMSFLCKDAPLSPIKHICLRRILPDLEDTPLRISGYLDFEALTTKGLLLEGVSTVVISLGRAVSLADTLD